MTKARVGLMPYISGSQFIKPRGPFYLSVIFTNCSGERCIQKD